MKKLNFKYFVIAIIIGVSIGKYIFNEYKQEATQMTNSTSNDIYLLQFGVYENEENMKNSTINLKNYFYYVEDKQYHVIIGITKDKILKDKILNAYEITDEVYLKKINCNNNEFLQLLDQYDNLLSQTNDKEVIVNSEKQILSRYQELIINE